MQSSSLLLTSSVTGASPRAIGASRRNTPRGRARSSSRAFSLLLIAGALALLVVPNVFVNGEVLLGYPIAPSVSGHTPLASLTAATTQAGSRCTGRLAFTSAVGSLLGTTATRGSIHINLPAACRAHRQVFPAALTFPAGTRFHAKIGLVSGSWSGNLGSLLVCAAQANRGCLSRQITITSASTVPLSTNNPVLISGNSYGPSLTTVFSSPGTATVDLSLAISVYSATGTNAGLVEQDWIQVVVVQA